MIVNVLIGIVIAILSAILGLLPSVDSAIITVIHSNVSSVNANLSYINWIFPSGDFVTFAKIILGVELTLLTFRITAWIINNLSAGFFKNSL